MKIILFLAIAISRQFVVDACYVKSRTCRLLDQGNDVAPDTDIGKALAESPSHCCGICEKTEGCNAWAWNIAGPTCYLKNETWIAPARDRTTRAGILGDVAKCSFHKGKDIATGEDLEWRLAKSPHDCCGICAGIAECRGWSWNVSPPRCYLKSSSTLVKAFDETTVSGILMRADTDTEVAPSEDKDETEECRPEDEPVVEDYFGWTEDIPMWDSIEDIFPNSEETSTTSETPASSSVAPSEGPAPA